MCGVALQDLFFYLSTFGSTTLRLEFLQAMAIFLAAVLAVLAMLCPLIRPRLLYQGVHEGKPHYFLFTYSQVAKLITRVTMLPIMQALFRPFACIRPTGRTGAVLATLRFWVSSRCLPVLSFPAAVVVVAAAGQGTPCT